MQNLKNILTTLFHFFKKVIILFLLLLNDQVGYCQYKNPLLTIVKQEKGYCFVNKNNKVMSKYYDTIRPFREGRSLVGLRVKSSKYRICWNILNEKCREILKTDSSRQLTSDFSEGYCSIWGRTQFGLMDRNGKFNDFAWCVSRENSNAIFEGGIAKCEVKDSIGGQYCYCGDQGYNPENFKTNYLDHDFKYLIPSKFDTISDFKPSQLRLVGKAGKYGFLDTLGKLKVPLIYDDVTAYYWKGWSLVKKDSLYAFIDVVTGNISSNNWFQNVLPSRFNFTWVKKENKWGVIDIKGKIIRPFIYNSVVQFDTVGRAIVQKGKYFGILDSVNKTIVPFQYQKIFAFHEGFSLVQKGNKFGFINEQGQEIVPANYISATHFVKGKAIVENNFYWQKIDKNGNISFNSLKLNSLIVIFGIISVIYLILIKLGLITRLF